MARKSLANIVKQNTDDEEIKRQKLISAVDKVGELNETYKNMGKQITENKDIIKNLLSELNMNDFTSPSGVHVTTTTIDKSFLDEQLVLTYLKEHGFENYIKTKEFFDQTEIAMAVANNEIPAADLAPFRVEKTEIRLNIKK